MSKDCVPDRLSSVAHYLAKRHTDKEGSPVAENTIISTNKMSNIEK